VGVVVGDRAVGVDADRLAEVGVGVLRRLEPLPLAGGDEQLAVGRERHARADVPAADCPGHLAPDDFQVGKLAAVEPGAGDGAAEEDRVVALEVLPEAVVALVLRPGRLLLGRLA
jgi:hypothetical protein